ncbi:2-oxoglutarate dehydrogenase E1 component [Rurimicrobium arvi]|uniref:oxoglutarate dehydrogenase (succinyl-transferring) n=1 Tax=Rurimicrobium arvi TaxID=2049916 RepID=A0ABP8MW64_9BACT
MQDFSYLTSSHPSYIEELYKEYEKNPLAADPEWKKFFEGFDYASGRSNGNGTVASAATPEQLTKEFAVYKLIQGYRSRGHLLSNTNPIRPRKDRKAELNLADFGLSDADLNGTFAAGQFVGMPNAKLSDIVEKLKKIYTNHIGIEYTYINNSAKQEWVRNRYESLMMEDISQSTRRRVLEKLNEAVIFEKFLHMKYIGQKRFGLDGGESTIPALDFIIAQAADAGVQEVVIGMAHRGRLNVLANTMGKPYEQIFSEFEGVIPQDSSMGSGDVKYHLGYRSDATTPNGKKIRLQLAPNPSHLEAVNPVVAGFARAKCDALYNNEYQKVLPILIHGDAAVAGQGIIYELLQMSKLEGYNNGGTIHFVINNQVGFTTDFTDARSSDYSTSIASMVQVPVLHVNGDDPEAVVRVCMLAVEYRQQFNDDVFIDMVCYRRFGHNEGDEPKFTQPKMYSVIEKHQNIRDIYAQFLLDHADKEAQNLAKELEKKLWDELQQKLDAIKANPLPYSYQEPDLPWQKMRRATEKDFEKSPKTAVAEKKVKELFYEIMKVPDGFKPLRKIDKLLQDKVKFFEAEGKFDWATGELLAYASLLAEGHDVRLSGEDVKRGTFSHRHAVLYDEQTNEQYSRLQGSAKKDTHFHIYNSLLSEYAVMGFEYGYAMANPDALAIWEAQYGDFANGAQIIIDQYLSGAEQKWSAMNGLVLLLPHGYEGGGPEHSNARPERFLQLSAELNMVITNITTAANFFHALRRQIQWDFRKPMVNFSPKANLRHARSFSAIEEFSKGGFQEVLDDPFIKNAASVKKVLLCTGKMYFDLSEKQIADNREDVAVVRLEQIHPIPVKQLQELHKKYKGANWTFVQEEPANMGWVGFLKTNFEAFDMKYLNRPASASTATGFGKVHAKEQAALVEKAFDK